MNSGTQIVAESEDDALELYRLQRPMLWKIMSVKDRKIGEEKISIKKISEKDLTKK